MPSSGDAINSTDPEYHTASAYGSPVNIEEMEEAFKKVGMTLAATFTNEDDFVGEGLGEIKASMVKLPSSIASTF